MCFVFSFFMFFADDGDWRCKRKKKSKKLKKSKKQKKKKEKEREREKKAEGVDEVLRNIKTELDEENGDTNIHIVSKPKKVRRKKKSLDGIVTLLEHSVKIENEKTIVNCDKKVAHEKRSRKHRVKIRKIPANDANILATIEAVVNGHSEPNDDGYCAGTTIEMKIEKAEPGDIDCDTHTHASNVNITSNGNGSSFNNILSMGKVDNVGLNDCASLMKLASETTSTRKKKIVTETNPKRRLSYTIKRVDSTTYK